jgi:hypothetical protein
MRRRSACGRTTQRTEQRPYGSAGVFDRLGLVGFLVMLAAT